jgi:hypothetical protein
LPQATPGTVLVSTQDTTFLTQAAQNDLQLGSLGVLAFSQSTNSQVQFMGGMAFIQSVQDLVQLFPALQAGGVSFPFLTPQQVFVGTSLASQSGLVFDQQLLTTLAQANILALQQTQTETSSGTNIQLRALASVRLAELQQLQALTLALVQAELSSSTFLGLTGSPSSVVVSTGASNGFATITNLGFPRSTNNNGFNTINNLGFPIGTSDNGFNTINNLGFPPATTNIGLAATGGTFF